MTRLIHVALLVPALLLAVLLPLDRATAQEAVAGYLEVDSFSFYFGASDSTGEQVPVTRLPVTIARNGTDTWALRVRSADWNLPPIARPDGLKMRWQLLEDATGSITGISNANGADVSISAEFGVSVIGRKQSSKQTLAFSTGTVSVKAGDQVIRREGVPLQSSSGYLNLVAAATDPPRSNKGVPFFVVISGRLVGLPN